jgi:hypothetical protein
VGYASGTKVSVLQTQGEIVGELARLGVSEYAFVHMGGSPSIAFKRGPVSYRLTVKMPDDASEQHQRSLWRSLGLVVKAKRVAIEEGVVTFEEEFMPQIVGTGGLTLAERILPKILALPNP